MVSVMFLCIDLLIGIEVIFWCEFSGVFGFDVM